MVGKYEVVKLIPTFYAMVQTQYNTKTNMFRNVYGQEVLSLQSFFEKRDFF